MIAELARRHDLWLMVDEVYAGLAPGGRVPSLAARLPERVVTLGSLSKSHAMTGWRAGWLVGPRELGGARRAARDVHAVRAARIHPGGGDHRAADCAARPRRACAISAPRAPRASPRASAASRAAAGRAAKPGMFMLIDVSASGLSRRRVHARAVRIAARLGHGRRRVRPAHPPAACACASRPRRPRSTRPARACAVSARAS